MDYADYCMIAWLHRKAGPKGRWLLEAILNRKLFRRIRVISSQLSQDLYSKIAELFLVQPESVVDRFVRRFEAALKSEVAKRWSGTDGPPESEAKALKDVDPLILID